MYNKLSYLCITLILMRASSHSLSQIPLTSEERAGLIALYEATDGANWKQNTGWLGEEGTECEWFGISYAEPRHGDIKYDIIASEPNIKKVILELILRKS